MAMLGFSHPGPRARWVLPEWTRTLRDGVTGWFTMARRYDGDVRMGTVTTNDLMRVGLSLVLCAALFVSDLKTPVEMNEVQLYPLAFLPLYRVQLRFLLPLFALLTIVLIVLGYSLAPDPDFWDGLSNRTFSIVMVVVTAACLGRLAVSERTLMLRALTDPLTGVFNRRTFLELSKKEAARAQRRGTLTSVLMLDIDHFKQINDSFGHPAGDLVIKALADITGRSLRPTDILARYGGEEFVVTLPETDSAVASRVAERLRTAIGEAVVGTEGGDVHFTVSVGVATFATGVSIVDAMARADQALYRAKQNGRDRVEVADPMFAEFADLAQAI